MKVLLLDGYNLMHRARFGFGKGDYNVIYNFFRGLKPLVEKFKPEKIYFVLEGNPKGNKETLPEYKANRQRSPDSFVRQRNLIEELINYLPITSIRHDDFECDDVLYSIVKNWHPTDDVTIVSSDSDFIQVVSEFSNVTLWNPVKKKSVESPDYDYVVWKALRGDKTDNIPGIKGIGDKTAESIVRDPKKLAEKNENPAFKEQFDRNIKLIKLEDLSTRMEETISTDGSHRFDKLKEAFENFQFQSMLKDKTWDKYVSAFGCVKKIQ